jgi:hypothetical protein
MSARAINNKKSTDTPQSMQPIGNMIRRFRVKGRPVREIDVTLAE